MLRGFASHLLWYALRAWKTCLESHRDVACILLSFYSLLARVYAALWHILALYGGAGINQGPLTLSSWSLIPDWFWAVDEAGTPLYRTRAVYYPGGAAPAPGHNTQQETEAQTLLWLREVARLRSRLRRAQMNAEYEQQIITLGPASAKQHAAAPLCCDGGPVCNNGGTGANAPALYRYEMPPLATDSGKGARFTGLGELLGEFETIYPPQLCGGGVSAATPMPRTCTSTHMPVRQRLCSN